MASYRGTLYTGVTNDLVRRVYEHRHKLVDGFTSKYNVSKLVFYEATDDVTIAISREKQIKGWRRSKKATIIESMDPYWIDLAEDWVENPTTTPDPSSRTVETLRVKHRSPILRSDRVTKKPVHRVKYITLY